MSETSWVEARIAVLQAEIKERQKELWQLRKLRIGPTVFVQAHYWRHGSHEVEVCKDGWREAQGLLSAGLDNGNMAPIGVVVNGEQEEWQDIFDLPPTA